MQALRYIESVLPKNVDMSEFIERIGTFIDFIKGYIQSDYVLIPIFISSIILAYNVYKTALNLVTICLCVVSIGILLPNGRQQHQDNY